MEEKRGGKVKGKAKKRFQKESGCRMIVVDVVMELVWWVNDDGGCGMRRVNFCVVILSLEGSEDSNTFTHATEMSIYSSFSS